MICVGIDPGLYGGIAVINEKEEVLHLFQMPVLKLKRTVFRISVLSKLFETLKMQHNEKIEAYIEKAHSRPFDSKKGAFTNGFGYGMLQTMMEVYKIPYKIIGAKTWQKEILKDYDKTDTKLASIEFCQRKYPDVDFVISGKKIKDGLTDALCIALYGVKYNG